MDETIQEHCGTDSETVAAQGLIVLSWLWPCIITTYNRSMNPYQIFDD